MTQPYSSDLRERVVRAHLAGEPIRQVAARSGVSASSVPKWVARYRATGSVAPGRIGGHRPWLLEPHRELVHRLVVETPHLTIDRLRDLLAVAGIAVSRDTIWRFLRREGLSFKKLCSPLSRRGCRQTVEPVFGIIKAVLGSPASRCAASTRWPASGPWWRWPTTASACTR